MRTERSSSQQFYYYDMIIIRAACIETQDMFIVIGNLFHTLLQRYNQYERAYI